MTLTSFFAKKSYVSGFMHSGIKIFIFGTQLLLLQNRTATSLKHNCHIFGTQLLLLAYNTALWATRCRFLKKNFFHGFGRYDANFFWKI